MKCGGGAHIRQGDQDRKLDAPVLRSVIVPGPRGCEHVAQLSAILSRALSGALGHARTDTVNRLHRLLLGLLPGGAKKFLSAQQARALLAAVRPRDIAGRTRRQLASELISELAAIDKKIKAANTQLTELVAATGSGLQGLNGIGPSSAARLLGDIGDIGRTAADGEDRHTLTKAGTTPS